MFKFFLKSLIIFSLFYSVSHAGTGAATEYKVTMTKLELCETGSATDNCLNPVTISPSSDSGAVDIAAVDAGVAAASYGNLNTATVGTTSRTHFGSDVALPPTTNERSTCPRGHLLQHAKVAEEPRFTQTTCQKKLNSTASSNYISNL